MRSLSLLVSGLLALLCAVPALAQEDLRPAKLMVVQPSQDVVSRRFFGRITARNTVDLSLSLIHI